MVVVVDAIQRDIGLIAASAVGSAGASVDHIVDGRAGGRIGVGDASLQTKNLDRVAAFKRKFHDLLGLECISHGGVGSVYTGSFARHFHCDRLPLHLHGEIHGRGNTDQQLDAFLLELCKAVRVDGDGIGRGRQLQELILAVTIGLHAACIAGLFIGERNRCVRQHSVFGIGNDSA